MSAPQPLDPADLHAILDGIWLSYLDGPADPLPHPEPVDGPVTATVAIHGAWAGDVTITLGHALAVGVAAHLLAVNLADVTEEDIDDAAGELVNILGGNLKAVLPEPSVLSLPTVARTDHPHAPHTCWFTANAHAIAVTVTTHPNHHSTPQ